MITICESQCVVPKNATLKQLADDIANRVRLGLDKVVLNDFYPNTFQMLTDLSFKMILQPLFQCCLDDKKAAVPVLALSKNLSAKPQDRCLGYLSGIDLSSKVSIQKQVKALIRPENIGLSSDDLFNERGNT
ncbi:MAG: hypothetical protein ACI8W9_001248 [Psychromonas sp.]|jgi:hypothetical protein